MDEPVEVLEYAAQALEDLGLRYAITGSMASMAYGDIRLTRDVDIVVMLSADRIPALLGRFPLGEFYVDRRAAENAVRSREQFNIIHVDSGIKIDIYVAGDAMAEAQIERARRLPAHTREVLFSSPEELIIRKMQFYLYGHTQRHLEDIVGMLYRSHDAIDRGRVATLVETFGLHEVWEAVQLRVEEAEAQRGRSGDSTE